ncbi:hypothetical protein LV469_01290 [Peptoniphilus sp. GNH]|nr:hypothetical protein LV469_01290 [Peptoniphilus sp. GNH]
MRFKKNDNYIKVFISSILCAGFIYEIYKRTMEDRMREIAREEIINLDDPLNREFYSKGYDEF